MHYYKVAGLILLVTFHFFDISHASKFQDSAQNAVENIQEYLKILTHKNSENGDISATWKQRWDELPEEYKIQASSSVSTECRRDYNQVSLDRLLGRFYAWQFYDSDGGLPPGVTDMNLNWLGSFDVCRRASKQDENDTEIFHGLYCLSYTQFIAMIGLRIGKCLPSTCSDEDAYHILSENFGWNVSSVVCARRIPFSSGDWATLIITAIFFVLVIAGTICDAIKRILTKKTNSGSVESFYTQNITETSTHEDSIGESTSGSLETQKHGLAAELLLSFSVGRTFPKILSSEITHKELKPMAGIIVLSLTYVILYNTSTTITYFTGNILSAFQKQREMTSLVVANGSTCFDSLFTVSGILVAYCTLKELDKNNGWLLWLKYYGYRLWSVLPIYTLALMWYCTLIRHIAYGPFQMEAFTRPDVAACSSYWWTNILFINNFVTGRIADQCMESSWYIANDMQFYFISPVIIILLYRKPKMAFSILFGLLAMCLVVRGVIAYEHEIQPLIYSPPKDPVVSDHFYLRPYYRIAPYLTGLFTGYLMWKTDCKVSMKWWIAVIGWLIAFTTGFIVVYGLIGYFKDLTLLPLGTLAFYQSVNRWVWSVAIAWSVFACVTGNGGPIAVVLGWSGFIPLVRLSFVTYLTHLHMVQTYLHSLMQPMPYTPYVVMYMYVGHVFLGFMLSLVCSSVIETPLNSVGKLITRYFTEKRLSRLSSGNTSSSTSTMNSDFAENMTETAECHKTTENESKISNGVINGSFIYTESSVKF